MVFITVKLAESTFQNVENYFKLFTNVLLPVNVFKFSFKFMCLLVCFISVFFFRFFFYNYYSFCNLA